jgi:hypothetical protein
MVLLYLLPVVLSLLLIAAHFLRHGNLVLVGVAMTAPLLLLIPRWWAARIVQTLLLVAAVQWLRTMVVLVDVREAMNQPWGRMVAILGVVMLFTLASGLMFHLPRLRRRYFQRPRVRGELASDESLVHA